MWLMVVGIWLLANNVFADTSTERSSWTTTQQSQWGGDNSGVSQQSGWNVGSNSPRPVYISPGGSDEQQGPQYLASMINQLNTERNQIMGPTPVPEYEHNGPPTPLSHGQLSTLYTNAVQQLSNIDLSKPPENNDGGNLVEPNGENEPGYYYYYYPITDMPDESNTENTTDMNDMMTGDEKNPEPKHVEPLFVAMASFIGLSTLFAFSVLFLPKFGSRKRSDPSDSLTPLTRSVMNALGPEKRTGDAANVTSAQSLTEEIHGEEEVDDMDSKGCPARLACEVGRVLRKMHLHRGPLRYDRIH